MSITPISADAWPGQSLGVCHRITWAEGSTCFNTQNNYNITETEFRIFNPLVTCNVTSPALGQVICVSSGVLPPIPSRQQNGDCNTYLVNPGDSCSSITSNTNFTLTIQQLQLHNNKICDGTWPVVNSPVCISSGTLPGSKLSSTASGPDPLLVPLAFAFILLIELGGMVFWHCKARKGESD